MTLRGLTASNSSGYTTRELSKESWPDLERLFRKAGVGDAWWCWCMYHQRPRSFENEGQCTRAERAMVNHREKGALVEKGSAHGIIVYAEDEPVGWCQYGPREELPRIDNSSKYRRITAGDSSERLWRITCFVVDQYYRKRGIASAGLVAALESIKKKGGGLVEAYPVSKTDQGPGYVWSGTASMFERTGFKMVAPFGTGRTTTVIMRKTV